MRTLWLSWSDVEPRLHPFDLALAQSIALNLSDENSMASHGQLEPITVAWISAFGDWTAGWNSAVVTSRWREFDLTHSEMRANQIRDLLCWRQWIELCATLFDRLRNEFKSDSEIVSESRIGEIVKLVFSATESRSGEENFSAVFGQTVIWYLQFSGFVTNAALQDNIEDLAVEALSEHFPNTNTMQDDLVNKLVDRIKTT